MDGVGLGDGVGDGIGDDVGDDIGDGVIDSMIICGAGSVVAVDTGAGWQATRKNKMKRKMRCFIRS